jgi:hypothetical protein
LVTALIIVTRPFYDSGKGNVLPKVGDFDSHPLALTHVGNIVVIAWLLNLLSDNGS